MYICVEGAGGPQGCDNCWTTTPTNSTYLPMCTCGTMLLLFFFVLLKCMLSSLQTFSGWVSQLMQPPWPQLPRPTLLGNRQYTYLHNALGST